MRLAIPERMESERLWITRLRYEDAEEIFYAYASKPEATRYVSWPTHESVEDTRSFLAYARAAWERGSDYSFSLRIKSTNRLIGSIGLIHDEGKIQFGYILSPQQWGMGYATEACRTVLAVIRSLPGIYRISTFVDVENMASVRVLQKAGLVQEARLEKWFRFVNQGGQPKDCLLFKIP
ncbi:MAG: GNAT family N-acetyltransferase [Cyclobacteriaceae bacterium]